MFTLHANPNEKAKDEKQVNTFSVHYGFSYYYYKSSAVESCSKKDLNELRNLGSDKVDGV